MFNSFVFEEWIMVGLVLTVGFGALYAMINPAKY